MNNPVNPSIRAQLLQWLLVPLAVLWVAGSIMASFLAVGSANEVFDQLLLDSADSIGARIRKRYIRIEIPASVLYILSHKGQDKFYYEIRSSAGEHLQGDNLPWPSAAGSTHNEQLLFDSEVNGQQVRLCRTQTEVPALPEAIIDGVRQPALPARTYFVEAAETARARTHFANQILASILIPQLIAVCLGATAIWLGIKKSLLSLQVLQNTISARSPDDLRPVPESDVPQEVGGLVTAINDLLTRVRNDVEKQKSFLVNAAHQLRTPVAGLKTYVGLAARFSVEPDLKKVLAQIDVGTEKLAHVTNRLLSLARAEPTATNNEFSTLDLNNIATEAASALVPEALKKDIDLALDTSERSAFINGNEESLTEMAVNLIENAILYTPEGGHVRVKVSESDTADLIVQDDGPGIPASEREKVFERFYRILGTEPSGSGLGLSIVKDIVSAHNAHISIANGEGEIGTIVKVSFQRAEVEHVSLNRPG